MVTSQQFGKCTAIWLGTLNGCFCLATTESCLVSYVCLQGKTYSTSIDRNIQTSCHRKNGKHASLEFLEPSAYGKCQALTGLHLNPDIMHTKWLGTDQYLLGGVLTILLEHKYDNLQQLCEELSSCSVCNNLYLYVFCVHDCT